MPASASSSYGKVIVISPDADADDTDTSITLTVSQSGALILLDEDEAYEITLPAITSSDNISNCTESRIFWYTAFIVYTPGENVTPSSVT